MNRGRTKVMKNSIVAGQTMLKTSAGGTGPWRTVDVLGFGAQAMAADASGNLFLGGVNGHWIIKKY